MSGIKAHTSYCTADGKRVPSVTTVLGVLNKPALVKWANNLGLQGIDSSKYVDKLARIGTLAHLLAHCELTGTPPDLLPYSQEEQTLALNALKSFHSWLRAHSVVLVASERPLVSEKHRFGGTIDLIAKVDGALELVDFKTSKALYKEHLYQVAAYKELAKEHGHKIRRVRVLRIGRTVEEGFEEIVRPALPDHWKVFKSALEIYRLQAKLENKPQ